MATVEEAIVRLKSERQRIKGGIQGYREAIESGAFLQPRRTMQRWIREDEAKVEAIDYAIYVLEGEEEEPCPD